MSRLIHGFAIGFAIWGGITLLMGYARLSPLPIVRGWRARIIGIIAMMPIPFPLVAAYLIAEMQILTGLRVTLEQAVFLSKAVEAGGIITACSIMYFLAWRWSQAAASGNDIAGKIVENESR